MFDVTFAVAFVAGLVSFLSPCVLPIVPGFLAYLGGASLQNPSVRDRRATILSSIFFVLGFASIFALLGVLLNTVLEAFAYHVERWLSYAGGAVIIFFGLYLAKLIKVPLLDREHKMRVSMKFSSRHLTSFVFGAAFAAGWTPCVGAALGAILGLAASEPTKAFALLMTYALGLGVPFIAVGIFASQADAFIAKHVRAFAILSVVFGYVLIALGVLVFTQSLSLIANFEILNKILL